MDKDFAYRHSLVNLNEEDTSSKYVQYMINYASYQGMNKQTYSNYEMGCVLAAKDFDRMYGGLYLTDDDVQKIKNVEITEDEKIRLFPYALMLACAEGNAFPNLIEQYIPIAKYLLTSNGWYDKIK